MLNLYSKLQAFLATREEGQGLVEYALIIVLIAILLVAALTVLKNEIDDAFRDISTTLGTR
jgi:pilus assembly protein Flp/PilA